MLGRRVDVHDEGDLVDVDAASGDVGGHQHAGAALGEALEVALAGVLRQVAVELDRRDAGLGELLGELLRAVLGAGEQQRAVAASGERVHDRRLVRGGHGEHVVRHRADRGDLGVDRVDDRAVEEALDEDVDALVERGGEQQALTLGGGRVHQAAHDGEEAEVGHVVGLVEDGDLHLVERAVTLLDEVLEAAGAGDDDVDAGAQRGDLRVLADATEDGDHLEVGGGGERRQGLGDLVGELTGGHQHQRTGPLRLTLGLGVRQAHHGGQREGERLAAAGAATAEHVTARHRVGQGGALDGERCGDAAACEHVGERLRHAQLGEGVDHHDGGAARGRRVRGGRLAGATGLTGLVGDGRGATTTALLGARAAAGTGGGGHDEGVLPEVVAVDAWPPSLG